MITFLEILGIILGACVILVGLGLLFLEGISRR